MRLILTIPHFAAGVGGAEGVAVAVVRELIGRGHDVCVLAEDGNALPEATMVFGDLNRVGQEKKRFAADVHIDWGLNVAADIHRLGGGTHRQFLKCALQAYPRPLRAVKRLGYRLSVKHRRIIMDEHHLVMRRQARFIAVSEFVARQLRECASPATPDVQVVYNGVDIERFSADRLAKVRRESRQMLGLDDADVAFLFVAHNLRLKNMALLKSLFDQLHEEVPRARLVLLSKRDPKIHRRWFIHAGTSSMPENIYAAADVLLHPTYYDACANVVLEALAAGLPVVSSDRNGSAEIIESGRHGYVLPVVGRRVEIRGQWSSVIRSLAGDAALRRSMGAAARALAGEHEFSSYVDRLEEVIG